MSDHCNTYYLTLSGPRRGERVVACVNAVNRTYAEKLFGCGLHDDKDFAFDGLYTEEEVIHMFRPGTDIIGTFNPNTGGCEIHRDYHNVPVFEVRGNKACRIKDRKQIPVDLDADKNTFERVRNVISGRISVPQAEEPFSDAVRCNDSGKYLSSEVMDALDSGFDEPSFDDEGPDIPSCEVNAKPVDLSSAYTGINVERKPASDAKDNDSVSVFDAMFYGSQKQVVQSHEFGNDEKLRARFCVDQRGSDIGKRIQSFLGIKK